MQPTAKQNCVRKDFKIFETFFALYIKKMVQACSKSLLNGENLLGICMFCFAVITVKYQSRCFFYIQVGSLMYNLDRNA